MKERYKTMKTTKTITVRETNCGYTVTTNYTQIGTTNNEPQAIEIARQWNIDNNENKNIIVKTDYYTHTIKNNKKW